MNNEVAAAGNRGKDPTTPTSRVYRFADYRFEPARRSLTRLDGKPVRLSNKSLDALAYFLDHAGVLIDRDTLLHALWPRRVVETNNLNQAIAGLRRTLGEHHVVTVAGRGYQWITPVVHSIAEAERGDTAAADATHHRRRWRGRAAAALALVLITTGGVYLATAPTRDGSVGLGRVTAIRPLTSYPGTESDPTLSPDGERIAFSWEPESDKSGIFWTAIGTSTPTRLTDPPAGVDVAPAWSPDGRQIAFLRRFDPARFDVVTVLATGGPERKLYSGEMRWISVEGFPHLAWTPDSRHLLFTTRVAASTTFALHRLTVATGTVTTAVPADERSYDTSPAVSPDGAWLAFTRYERGKRLNRVMVLPLDREYLAAGEPRALPGLDAGIYMSTAWNPTGDRLFVTGSGSIFEWRKGGSARQIHTVGTTLASPSLAFAWQGAAARMAVATRSGNPDIFAQRIDPITREPVGAPSTRASSSAVDSHARFSPDGTRLAFVSNRNDGRLALWVSDADGEHARQMTHLDELVTGFPRWSPDGKRIAFHTSARNEERVIYEVTVDTGMTRRLFNGCCPGGWSADGRYLYVTDISPPVNRVVRVDVTTGSREPLFEGEVAIESADGRYLLYAKTREPGYFRRSLQGRPADNPEERLVEDYRPSAGGLQPVADGFFYIGQTPDGTPRAIRFYDYARKEARDVAPVPSVTGIGMTVSPDGRELVYSSVDRPAADIMLYEFAPATER